MAIPEDEIAAGELVAACQIERAAKLGGLHVGVARAAKPGGLARELDEPRAVEPDAGAAAPEIGRAEKGLGQ